MVLITQFPLSMIYIFFQYYYLQQFFPQNKSLKEFYFIIQFYFIILRIKTLKKPDPLFNSWITRSVRNELL